MPNPNKTRTLIMLYLTNGGADDVPTDELFLSTQPFSVVRSMDPPTYPGFGGPIDITITVEPQQQSGIPITVVENVPNDLRVSEEAQVSAGSVSGAGSNSITWEIPSLDGPQTMTYTVFVDSGETDTFAFSGSATSNGIERITSGQADLGLLSFFIFETFAFPLNNSNENEGKGLTEVSQPPGGGGEPIDNGWASFWTDPDDVNDSLNTRIIDAGLVRSQPQEFNPGNFSLELSGDGTSGVRRQLEPVNTGEFWLSFTFLDEGPAAEHFAGITLFDSNGNESSFVGKPFNSEVAGLANLPGGDSLTEADFTQPHHYLVRYVLDSDAGQNDSVFLWIDPDKEDNLGTYDAGGENNDNIVDIAEVRLRRGTGAGSSFWDNIFISSVPALPPEGAGRAEMYLDDPDNRPAEIPGWDVVSIDAVDDTIFTGSPGFGHDTGDNLYLVVSGFMYFDDNNDQLVGFGLPPDRMTGLNGHLLGPYNFQFEELNLKNSVKFENLDGQRGPFTFDIVPPGNYSEARAIMTVGNGDGELFVTFNYEDGSTTEGVFHADDWFDDPPGLTFDDVVQLINGMNRLEGDNSFDGRFDPAFFEDTSPEVDPSRVLTSVTLELNTDVDGSNALNLYSILAIPEEVETSVEAWNLY